MKKLWGGRFKQSTDALMETFSASISFDKRLYACDIEGSIAHCKMLAHCKIISPSESQKIQKRIETDFKGMRNGTVRVQRQAGRYSYEYRKPSA